MSNSLLEIKYQSYIDANVETVTVKLLAAGITSTEHGPVCGNATVEPADGLRGLRAGLDVMPTLVTIVSARGKGRHDESAVCDGHLDTDGAKVTA